MYKPTDKSQNSFLDFKQPIGLHMNPNNRWIKMADLVPWDEFETKYAGLFPSPNGNVAKPLRMVLGALIINYPLMTSTHLSMPNQRWMSNTQGPSKIVHQILAGACGLKKPIDSILTNMICF
jgi:hypothetical protein